MKVLQDVFDTLKQFRARASSSPHLIYIIDDEEQTRWILKDLIEPLKFEVKLLHSGEEVLGALSQSRAPALVICSLAMSKPSAPEILKLFPRKGEMPLFLMMTSLSSRERLDEAIFLGASDSIEKPFESEAFVAKVQDLLKKYEKSKRPERTKRLKTESFSLSARRRLQQIRHFISRE